MNLAPRKCTPDCPERVECVKCGKKLCHLHEELGQGIKNPSATEGRYQTNEGSYCIACWPGSVPPSSRR